MTATYHHDHVNAFNNPSPVSFDVLDAAGMAIANAAQGHGPLARANPHRIDGIVLPIMGSKLSPSPELDRGGAGVLDVDYADGSTRTFDVDGETGTITPRRYAYAFAAVVEADHMLSEEERGEIIDECSIPASIGAEIVFASTPRPIALNSGDYSIQPCIAPRDERTTR